MKKLMAFLMFLSATTMGAAAQEVSGLTQPITPSYSDILMMKAMASSDVSYLFYRMPVWHHLGQNIAIEVLIPQ